LLPIDMGVYGQWFTDPILNYFMVEASRQSGLLTEHYVTEQSSKQIAESIELHIVDPIIFMRLQCRYFSDGIHMIHDLLETI